MNLFKATNLTPEQEEFIKISEKAAKKYKSVVKFNSYPKFRAEGESAVFLDFIPGNSVSIGFVKDFNDEKSDTHIERNNYNFFRNYGDDKMFMSCVRDVEKALVDAGYKSHLG